MKALGIASTYRLDHVANREQVLGDFSAHKRRWSIAIAHYERHAEQMKIPTSTMANYGHVRRELVRELRGGSGGR